MSEKWYDLDIRRARQVLAKSIKYREEVLARTRDTEEGRTSEGGRRARWEAARALILKRLSLSYKISHPDPEGGEEESLETVQAVFDFVDDGKSSGAAIFQSVVGPPECGFLTELPVKLSHVTKLFRSLGSQNLEPFEVRGVVRCGGANHRAQIHEGTLTFRGFKIEDLEAE